MLTFADAVVARWWLSSRIITPAGLMVQGARRASDNGGVSTPTRVLLPFLVERLAHADS